MPLDYPQIISAIRENPYMFGGENRLDTEIIQKTDNLIAKVGAGGLCVVVNIKTKEAFIVKICDSDMKARELVVITILKNLKWADIEADTSIKTLHNDIVGKIEINI